MLSLIEAEEEKDEEREQEEEDEGFVDVTAEKLEAATATTKRSGPARRQRRRETTRLDLGGEKVAAGGFAAELCARSHVASRGGVHALFARAPSSSPEGEEGGEEEDSVAPFEWPGFLSASAAPAATKEEAKLEEDEEEEEAKAAGAEAAALVAEALVESAATATNPAEAALAFYEEFAARLPHEAEEAARVALSKARGGFSFVVFDANQQRLVAARDPLGLAPLAWGVKGGLLMLGSDPEDLAGCEPSATAFGAGTLFVSDVATEPTSPGARGFVLKADPAMAAAAAAGMPGRLLSFVPSGFAAAASSPPSAAAAALAAERERRRRQSLERRRGQRPPQAPASSSKGAAAAAAAGSSSWRGIRAVPRLNAEGVMCGAVYRVASEGSLPSAVF